MSKVSYQVLAGITSFLSFTSVIGSCYIIYGAIKVRQSLKNRPSKNNPLFITEHVLWMSVCDVMQQSWLGFSWLPVTFDASWNANWPSTSCQIVGIFAQFFLLASASWNFIISISLLRMLMATPIYKFRKEIKYNHIFAWGVSTVCCIIPLAGNAYGYTANIELNYGLAEFECWIQIPQYQLCLYLPAMIYVFFATILLIFTFIRARTKHIQHTSAALRLVLYTVVFVITWTFPIILRLHGMISDSPPHTFTVWAHHILIACIGIGNALIWGTSKSIKSEKSKTSKSSTNCTTTKTTRSKEKSATKSSHNQCQSKSNFSTNVELTPAPPMNHDSFTPVSTQREIPQFSPSSCKMDDDDNVNGQELEAMNVDINDMNTGQEEQYEE